MTAPALRLGDRMLAACDPFLVYVAGFFDGEGCICIDSQQVKGASRRAHRLRITVTNTNADIIAAIRGRWPGGYVRVAQKGKGATRDCYQLSYNSKDAIAILREISPWLWVKKGEADIALEYAATIQPRNRGRAMLPEGVWEKRQGCLERLRALRGYPRP